MALEGIVSKRADAPYTPGNRGLSLKVKCLHREEFVVIGWTDPEGARPFLGALLLGYYDPNAKLICAGRVGAGIDNAELERLGGACSRSRPTLWRSTSRRRAAASSARRPCSAACIGCSPNCWPK